MTTVKAASRAWWMSVVIILAILSGVYFGYPQLEAGWKTTTIKGILKKNARTCAQGHKQQCVDTIIAQTKAETGVDLLHEDIRVPVCDYNNVHYSVSYRVEVVYPLTGTMIGSKKKRYKRYTYKEKIKLSGY